MKHTIYIVGGDLRQTAAADFLSRAGFHVKTVGLFENGDNSPSVLSDAETVVFPLPTSFDDLHINTPLIKEQLSVSDTLNALPDDCFVLGAKMSDNIRKRLTERRIKFCDYSEREELIIKNAVPTAEGALEIALSEMPITVFGSRVLILGFGRVGKATAALFSGVGADVTVSARKKSDLAAIEMCRMHAVHTGSIAAEANKFDLIINTVPSVIITEDVLKAIRPDALITDLASKPGGVDFAAAQMLGRNVIHALSLPGKTAPITSGKIIAETIINILSETEV